MDIDYVLIPSLLTFRRGSIPALSEMGASYFKIMEMKSPQTPLEENFRCGDIYLLDQCFAEAAKSGKYISIHPMDLDWYLRNSAAVNDGTIGILGSDHSPHIAEHYHPEDLFASAQGVPGEDYYGNLLLDAVNAEKLSLERLAKVTSANGAQAFDRKGKWPTPSSAERLALSGGIDLIITKSVSRFARNTVDSLSTIRKLKENGCECYFEKENIWTFDSKGERTGIWL